MRPHRGSALARTRSHSPLQLPLSAVAGRFFRPGWFSKLIERRHAAPGGSTTVMRHDHRLRFSALFLSLLILGAGLVSADAAKRAKDLELTILTSTSNRGEVDPCG